MKQPIDFINKIERNKIKVIDTDKLIINDYPMGFKKCIMTFEKTRNRNGQIIKRTSIFNGKVSKPKKTTSARLNIFVYDEEENKHYIVCVNGVSFCLYNTAFFTGNNLFKDYYFSPTNKEYQHEIGQKHRKQYSIMLDFLKPYLNITEEVYQKLKVLNGEEPIKKEVV